MSNFPVDLDREASLLLKQIERFIPGNNRPFVQRMVRASLDRVYTNGYSTGMVSKNRDRQVMTPHSGHFGPMMVVKMRYDYSLTTNEEKK